MSETLVTTTEVQFDNNDDLDAFTTDFFGQKKVDTEQASSKHTIQGVDAEQDVVEEAEVEETEAQKTEVDPNEDPEAEYKEAPPKKKTVQDRIDELVRQREDTKREAAAEIERLRKEFEEFKQRSTPQEAVKKSAEPTPNDLKEDGTPKYDLGEFDPQYIRDLTRYTLDQERSQAALRAEEEAKVRQETEAREALTSEWNQRVKAAEAEYPDFMEKGQTLLAGFNNLDQGYAGYLSTVLMSMEKGPDVLYYLSNHPEEAVKIVNSGAQKATLALGRIEAKFLEADAQKQVAKPRISKAPPPSPVQSRGTAAGHLKVEPDTDDLDAFSKEFFVRRRS
jgi:hypothetical protein